MRGGLDRLHPPPGGHRSGGVDDQQDQVGLAALGDRQPQVGPGQPQPAVGVRPPLSLLRCGGPDGRRQVQPSARAGGLGRADRAPGRREGPAAPSRFADSDARCGEQPGPVRRPGRDGGLAAARTTARTRRLGRLPGGVSIRLARARSVRGLGVIAAGFRIGSSWRCRRARRIRPVAVGPVAVVARRRRGRSAARAAGRPVRVRRPPAAGRAGPRRARVRRTGCAGGGGAGPGGRRHGCRRW